MKILVDIGHPAHVHYFKNLIVRLKQRGYEFTITARDKEIAHYLLHYYGFEFFSRGEGSDTLIGKLVYLIKADYHLLRIALKEKPDLFLSFGSPYCAQVSSMMGKDHIVLDDTENANLGQLLYRAFSNCILSPSCFKKKMGSKHLKFPSYMELAYLHPNVFKANDKILTDLGVSSDEKYVVLRFVGWGAVHDLGHKGITTENKIKVVNEFAKFAKVFISSEEELPEQISKYKLKLPPEKMHDVLAFADMFYGESATMASESAVLGTPAIYLDNEGRGYTNEQETKYGLVYNFSESENDQKLSIEKGVEILTMKHRDWAERKEKLLDDKMDLTAFLVWFVENYPEHKRSIPDDKKLQEQFKVNTV